MEIKKENPLTLGTGHAMLPQPCVLVIFGAAGDLSWRKLMPAVYNLNVDGVLPSNFAVVGFGLGAEGDPDEWIRQRARDGTARFSRRPPEDSNWQHFARCVSYVNGSFNDARAYAQLKARLESIDQQFGVPGSRVFYLAVPPNAIATCVDHLKSAGMVASPTDTRSFTRVIVEKPIGRDLESARKIIADVGKAFAESQTYRIDHYLGKETVQNLLVIRFANSIFEPLWNKNHIDHVQITVAEEEGLTHRDPKTHEVTGSRIGYYEGVGALRDMVQNHILQVLCVTAMEPPWSLAPDVVRDAKIGVLRCLRPMTREDVKTSVVRAQYIAGDIHGDEVPGYRHEVREYFTSRKEAVPSESTT
jgi:glucose-6-phosphate 1-dehydrogenase